MTVAGPEAASSALRRKSLVLPREHGAWGIVLIPLFTGAAVGIAEGGGVLALVPLAIVTVGLFWLRAPAEVWLGTAAVRARTTDEARQVQRAVVALAGVSIAALVWLFWGGRYLSLLWIGAAAAAAFAGQIAVKKMWKARIAAQMIGAAGLTATAPAAYYVATGGLDGIAWTLWIANLLFAFNQIHFVQLRIHAARAFTPREKMEAGRGFLTGQVALMAALAVASMMDWFSWHSSIAFVPVLGRGFAWFAGTSEPLAVHALGWRELMHACVFAVLLVIGIELSL